MYTIIYLLETQPCDKTLHIVWYKEQWPFIVSPTPGLAWSIYHQNRPFAPILTTFSAWETKKIGDRNTSLQQKRVYTSLGSSCPTCVHQSWEEYQRIVLANMSKPYDFMFWEMVDHLSNDINAKYHDWHTFQWQDDIYRCTHWIRLVYALSACIFNIDMHVHIIL